MSLRDHKVIIVGGGIIGLALGFRLSQEKVQATILDRGQPGSEASWAAAGMLAPTSEHTETPVLEPLLQASARLYPQWVGQLEETSGLTVGLDTVGTLQLAFNEAEVAALPRQAGESLAPEELRRLEPALSPRVLAGVRLPQDVQVDNRRLVAALVEACRRRGVSLELGREAQNLRVERNHAVALRLADGSELTGDAIVNAAGSWAHRFPHAPVRPVRGQMIALTAETPLVRHVVRSPRAYLVPRQDARLLLGSTMEDAGYDKSLTPTGLGSILAGAKEIAPAAAALSFADAWAGLRPDTPDHLPILGATDIEGYFVATGHFRNGILLAPITAEVMTDVLLGRPPAVPIDAFNPMRFRNSR
jgi:glycine oxidase